MKYLIALIALSGCQSLVGFTPEQVSTRLGEPISKHVAPSEFQQQEEWLYPGLTIGFNDQTVTYVLVTKN